MKVGIKKQVEVEAKTLKIHMKVRDEFSAQLVDQDGELIKDYKGYVPDFMPDEHYGEYLILDIDIDTGKIINWAPPTDEAMEKFINGEDEFSAQLVDQDGEYLILDIDIDTGKIINWSPPTDEAMEKFINGDEE